MGGGARVAGEDGSGLVVRGSGAVVGGVDGANDALGVCGGVGRIGPPAFGVVPVDLAVTGAFLVGRGSGDLLLAYLFANRSRELRRGTQLCKIVSA